MRPQHIVADLLVVARICLSCALLFLLWSCDVSKTDFSSRNDPTKLIGEIESYTTTHQFLEAHPQVKVDQGGGAHPGDKWRSKYEVKQVTLLNYHHFGQAGKLVVSFFNDRLMSATFYPIDMVRYLSELNKNGIELKTGTTSFSVNTMIRVGTDYQGNKYVVWEDNSLAKEISEWIKKNS